LVEGLAKKLAHASSQSQGHRQIEARAFFAYISGGEVDGYALAIRKFKTAISQCRFNAFAAFFHGVVGEAHDVEILHARGAYVYFDFNEVGVDSVDGGADGFKEHFLGPGGRSLKRCSLIAVGREATGGAR